jgi:hypothetical protein
MFCFLLVSYQAEISDASGSQWVNIFRNEAEALLGLTADEFGNHKINVTIDLVLHLFFERHEEKKKKKNNDNINLACH